MLMPSAQVVVMSGIRLGPIKASPGVPLNPQGSGERCTFGSVRHKKGDILLECVIWGSGKLQCEAFIGPRRVGNA